MGSIALGESLGQVVQIVAVESLAGIAIGTLGDVDFDIFSQLCDGAIAMDDLLCEEPSRRDRVESSLSFGWCEAFFDDCLRHQLCQTGLDLLDGIADTIHWVALGGSCGLLVPTLFPLATHLST